MPGSHKLRPVVAEDACALAAIYNHYVRSSHVTFEELEVSAVEFEARIEHVQASALPWLVLEGDEGLAGYAVATPYRARSAYRHTVETTIYLADGCAGRGLGHTLYAALIDELRELDLRVAIGAIALPNQASAALHESLGFRQVGQLVEVGKKFGRWIDVGYWQLSLTSGEATD